jgi:hypothetical protein
MCVKESTYRKNRARRETKNLKVVDVLNVEGGIQ